MRAVSAASPNITGTIGCSPGSRSKPASVISARNSAAFADELRPQVVRLLEQVERGERAGDDRRRERVREQVRPRALAQQVDDLAPRRHVAAGCAAQRLAERPGVDVDPVGDAAELGRPAAVLADEADRVRVVDEHQRAELVGQVADLGERRDVAVHREHAVGDDHAEPAPASCAACSCARRSAMSRFR